MSNCCDCDISDLLEEDSGHFYPHFHLSLEYQTLVVLPHSGNVCFEHKVCNGSEKMVEVTFIWASFGRYTLTRTRVFSCP